MTRAALLILLLLTGCQSALMGCEESPHVLCPK